jgi:gluconokinase
MIVIVMGAAGAGKSTVGRALADALGWGFLDADALHSSENVERMRRGVPLTHQDRGPWLTAVRRELDAARQSRKSLVVACSALTADYRTLLAGDYDDAVFVYLKADAELLEQRLRDRIGHFAGPSLLASQLALLEEPVDGALTLDAARPVDTLVRDIRESLDA